MRKLNEAEASSPVNIVWDDALTMPLGDVVDSQVARVTTEAILEKIDEIQAKATLLDVLSVDTVDSAVVNQIIKITRITKLMVCKCAILGVSSEIAINVVNAGVRSK